jgi:hypothetical protein
LDQSILKRYGMTTIRIIRRRGRQTLLALLLAAPAIAARAQYNITPLAVSPIYLKSQLWAVSVSNTGGPIEARLQMDLKDAESHQSVLAGASAIFRVPTGAMVLSLNSLEPIVYSYNSPVVVDRTPNGPLPVGQYQVCYQLLLMSGERQGVVAEDCDELAVEPFSPPLLTSPEDDSIVRVAQPNFTWTPPAPTSMFDDLSYDVIISEVNEGQSVSDAIQKNLPVQQAQGLRTPFLTYPLTGPQLDTGKTYAWQVVARNQQTYAAKSEVWSFRTPGTPLGKTGSSSVYIVMNGKLSGVGVSDSSALHIKYVSYSSVYSATVTIRSDKGQVMLTSTMRIRQGDNYLDIPLDGRLAVGQRYTAFVPDPAGRQTSVTFIVK